MEFSSLVDTSLDLNIRPFRVLDDALKQEVQSNFIGLGPKTPVKEETGALVEELNRVSAENKKLTEMLTVLCENYNALRAHMSKINAPGLGKRKSESNIENNYVNGNQGSQVHPQRRRRAHRRPPTRPLVSKYLPASSSNPTFQEFGFFPESSLEPSVDDSPRISCSDLSEAEEEALDTIRNVLLNDDSSETSSFVEFHWDSIDRVKIIKKQGTVESENDEPDRHSHRIETSITELQSDISGAERSVCDMSSPRVESPVIEKWLQSQLQEAVDGIDQITVRKGAVRKLDEEYGIDSNTLHQYSDRKLEDAARILGVSRSTLKRICRKHGIFRWPPCKIKKSKSTFEESSQATKGNDEDQRIQESVSNLRKGSPSKTTALRDARKIMVKVSCEDDIVIKFDVSLSSTKLELEEKVALRLKLAVGSFSVRYKDEENEWIFLACDEDLRTCINASTASGKSTAIRMKVSKCI